MRKQLLIALLLTAVLPASAQWGVPVEQLLQRAQQRTQFNMLKEQWSAAWIEVPDTDCDAYGVYYFRKDIDLTSVPSEFKIHVSADQRYKLYVNGVLFRLAQLVTIRSTGTTRPSTSPAILGKARMWWQPRYGAKAPISLYPMLLSRRDSS